MNINTRMKRSLAGFAFILASACLATGASAGTYDMINIYGSSSQFAGLPDSYTYSSTGDPIDIESVQIANDSNFLYLNVSFYTAVNVDAGSASGQTLNLGIDTDNNTATGFNIYGNTGIGSDLAYQYDYPFTQSSGNFNSGVALTGAGASISPYYTTTSDEIIAIPLTSTYTSSGALVFNQSTIALELYGTNGTGSDDATSVISYTIAGAPEPPAYILIVGAFGLLFVVARRRHVRA